MQFPIEKAWRGINRRARRRPNLALLALALLSACVPSEGVGGREGGSHDQMSWGVETSPRGEIHAAFGGTVRLGSIAYLQALRVHNPVRGGFSVHTNFWEPDEPPEQAFHHGDFTSGYLSTGESFEHRGAVADYYPEEYMMHLNIHWCEYRSSTQPCVFWELPPAFHGFKVVGTKAAGSDPQGGIDASPRQLPQEEGSDISRSLWDGEYHVAGSLKVRRGIWSREFAPPVQMTSRFTKSPRSVVFFGSIEGGEGRGMGMILHLGKDEGTLTRMSIISPAQKGTSTYGLFLRREVSWLDLPVGESSASLTKDGKYKVRVERQAQTAWRISVEPVDADDVYPWFSRATVDLDASAPAPPWKRVRIGLETSNGPYTTSGELVLEKVPNREAR